MRAAFPHTFHVVFRTGDLGIPLAERETARRTGDQ
jgi:hypothetical protein